MEIYIPGQHPFGISIRGDFLPLAEISPIWGMRKIGGRLEYRYWMLEQ